MAEDQDDNVVDSPDPYEHILDPDDEAEADVEYHPELDESVDVAETPGLDREASLYDTSWSPPDRPPHRTEYGTTLSEMREGESLDQLLAEEEPDVFARLDESEGVATSPEDEVLADPYANPAPRAGRLVEEDEGAHPDDEPDLVALDVGISGGAASAEEAAVHVVDEDEIIDVEESFDEP
jgi:Family of unknown function (DUF5709)